MTRFCYSMILLSILFNSIKTYGQAIFVKNDSIPFAKDTTAILFLNKYRGNAYWQQSFDNKNWFTVNNIEFDSLRIDLKNNAFYRAKIIDGTCNPEYSDTVKIAIADSLEKAFEQNIFLNIPDSTYETIEFITPLDTITCQIVGKDTVFQGDIILTKEEIQKLYGLKGATSPKINLWPNNIVYYFIPDELIGEMKITQAIENWNNNTTLSFIKLDKQNKDFYSNYIEFVYSSESVSRSSLGMESGKNGKPQYIKISKQYALLGSVIHEIGHAVGLAHEHARPDRDKFIKIIWSNIQLKHWIDFRIDKNAKPIGNYDCWSIMHYPSINSFAKNINYPTLYKSDNACYFIPFGDRLSPGDISTVSILYPPLKPTVTTASVTNITQTTATGGGNVISDGGATVTARGVCWDITGTPTIANNKTSNGSGTGSFVSNITGLTANTPYYIRAYATNSQGTAYGSLITFTTNQASGLPTVITNSINDITQSTATGGGNVTYDGGATVTTKGVCWNTTGTPTIVNSKTSNGAGTGSFTSNLTWLNANTQYYVRAYATNSVGTAYGEQITFKTLSSISLGQEYGGGIIIYIDNTGQHGLIAAKTDQISSIQWYNGSFVITGATDKSIGSGQDNTNKIISALGQGDYAASLCDKLSLNGYSDWFLPSQNELTELLKSYEVLGINKYDYYWSSTDSGCTSPGISGGCAYCRSYSNGASWEGVNSKNKVRAIRKF